MNFRLSLLPLFLLTLLFVLGSCTKSTDEGPDYGKLDKDTITAYIKANNLIGFKRDTSGVYIAITKIGAGPVAKEGQTLIVKYTGTVLNGTPLPVTAQSTNGFPFVLGSGGVIEGWEVAFKQLSAGSQATLLVPSDKAYGGAPPKGIPNRAVLRFDVELLQIK